MTAKKSSGRRSSSKLASPQEIAPGVFLGSRKDAEEFSGVRFCVLDQPPDDLPTVTHVRIYEKKSDAPIVENLDRLADAVHDAQGHGEKVLLFCAYGVRRGPLAAAWYLHKYEGLSVDEAFDKIGKVRPEVERPKEWIGNAEALEE
jgi:protein-tyrosine phosphatase